MKETEYAPLQPASLTRAECWEIGRQFWYALDTSAPGRIAGLPRTQSLPAPNRLSDPILHCDAHPDLPKPLL